jgi:hypothetical protein
MNETHLPDDLSRWPTDPYAILGIQRGVAPRDLRRAYTKLIRVFKPERHPEHFRRIREAFDYVQKFAAFFVEETPAEPVAPPPTGSTDPLKSEVASVTDEPVVVIRPSPVPARDSAEDLWARAVDGDALAANRGLTELVDRTPGRADLYARLYWLAVLFPDVDSNHSPVDWLCQGIEATGANQQLLSLLGSELGHNPGEASNPRWQRCLSRESNSDHVAALTYLRWQALCRVGNWGHVRTELETVRKRLRLDNEAAWLRLMCEIANWIAWGRTDSEAVALAADVRTEIRSLEHLALRHGYFFDQLDQLDALKESCAELHRVGDGSVDFLITLRDGWALPFELVRERFEKVLRQISDDPHSWIELFDRIGPPALAALTHFDVLLSRYQAELGIAAEIPHPAAQLRRLAERALARDIRSAGLYRARIVRFCLDEAVSPADIGAAFDPSAGGPAERPDWVRIVVGDFAIGCVCRACRLFRA